MSGTFTELIPVTSLFLAVLLHFVWQATLIVAVVAISRSLIHPRFFRGRYLLSVIGLFGVLISPLVTIGFYVANPEAMNSLRPPVAVAEALPLAEAQAVSFPSLLETQFQVVFSWFDNHRLFWLGCWLIGFTVLLTRLSVSLGHCLRLRRRQKPLPPHLQELATNLKRKLNLTRNVMVASSQEITQAIATGIIKPVVLIPAAWVTQLPAASIEAVLAHELAHLKRWDLWINLLQRFAETVFFFHPLVWWLSSQISSEREVCCDQLAIETTGQPMKYVETLAQVADTTTFNEFEVQFGTAFIGGKNMNLLRRAKMILEPSSVDAQSPFRTVALIACTGLMICYGSYAYCATPAVLALQDHDREHAHEHSDHDHDHDHDGDHEHARDGDREHNIVVGRKNLKSDQGGRLEIVVVGDESHDESMHEKLHGHLVELLHGRDSGKIDKKNLARQLRQLADRLEAEGQSAGNNQKVRRRVEVQRRSNHPVENVEFDFEFEDIDISDAKNQRKNRFIEQKPNTAKQGMFLRKVDPNNRTITVEVGDRRDLHSGNKEHDQVITRERVPAAGQMHSFRWVQRDEEEDHQDEFEERAHVGDLPHERELHFGHATTSDGELGQVLRELKNEVQQLRREVNQLRSNRVVPTDRPVRDRVQERRLPPERRIEVREFLDVKDREAHEKRRVVPKNAPPVKKKSGNVWIDSKTVPKNVWVEGDTKARAAWVFESKSEAGKSKSKTKAPKTKKDDEVRLEVISPLESAGESGKWVVEVEEVEGHQHTPKTKTQLRILKEGNEKSDPRVGRFNVEVKTQVSKSDDKPTSDDKSKTADKPKSPKNKKKK